MRRRTSACRSRAWACCPRARTGVERRFARMALWVGTAVGVGRRPRAVCERTVSAQRRRPRRAPHGASALAVGGRRHTRAMTTADRASALLALHRDPALLRLVNVWDVASARTVAAVPETTALATASHSIAAMYGYEDGENIPRRPDARGGRPDRRRGRPAGDRRPRGRATATRPRPSAARSAIGVVGANIEDQMKPLAEAVAVVEAVMQAAAAEGVPDFVLNARTDAVPARRRPRPARRPRRGDRARHAPSSTSARPWCSCPARLGEEQVAALVDAFGPQRLTMLAGPRSAVAGTGSRSWAWPG